MKQILIFLICLFISQSAFAARCTDYITCKKAVIAWCEGKHPRADGDNDGIPCENVCSSLDQVKEIKKEIGCTK